MKTSKTKIISGIRVILFSCSLLDFFNSYAQSSVEYKISNLLDPFQEKLLDSLGVIGLEISSYSRATQDWMFPKHEVETIELIDEQRTTIHRSYLVKDSTRQCYETLTIVKNEFGDIIRRLKETDRSFEDVYIYNYDNENRIIKEVYKRKLSNGKLKPMVIRKYRYENTSNYDKINIKEIRLTAPKKKRSVSYSTKFTENHFSEDSLLVKKTFRQGYKIKINIYHYDSSSTLLQRESWVSFFGNLPYCDSLILYNSERKVIQSMQHGPHCSLLTSNYIYNENGQLEREEHLNYDSPSNSEITVIKYSYSSDGLLVRKEIITDYGSGLKITEHHIKYDFESTQSQ